MVKDKVKSTKNRIDQELFLNVLSSSHILQYRTVPYIKKDFIGIVSMMHNIFIVQLQNDNHCISFGFMELKKGCRGMNKSSIDEQAIRHRRPHTVHLTHGMTSDIDDVCGSCMGGNSPSPESSLQCVLPNLTATHENRL